LALRGLAGTVSGLGFSPDGRQLLSRDLSGKPTVWDLASGKPLPGAKPWAVAEARRSPDGRLFALVEENVIRLVACGAEEFARDAPWLLPDPDWHAAQAQEAQQQGLWFAAAFHQGRLLRDRPWDAELHARRAHALDVLGRTREAALHYLRAVSLDPRVRLWP